MKRIRIALCLLISLNGGCTNKDELVMPDHKKMETICMGRHLIDLPEGFKPMLPLSAIFRPQSGDETDTSIDVNVLDLLASPEVFAAGVEKKRGELVAASRGNTNVLKDVLAIGRDSTLFRIQEIKDSYTSELHLLKGKVSIGAKVESYDGHFNEAETALFAFAKNLDAPTTKGDRQQTGFCLGPIVVQGLYKFEFANFFFRSEAQPDVTITIDIDTYGRDGPGTLLQRMTGPNSLLEIFNVRHAVIRKGELNIAGMPAQEWLGSTKLGENADKKQFKFALETRRMKPGPVAPRIHIELDTGQNDRTENE
jgi:hypothetical protein